MAMNEAFIANMTGKTVKFDVQPYARGVGVIEKMTPRVIKVREFIGDRGYANVEYEVYDLEIRVTEGSKTGALWGGVAVKGTVKGTAGELEMISGVNYGKIARAVRDGETIVIARCG